ncbi:CBS domain-containing protein [Streptomyces zaomyceticus]|uniref:CBS domain-containing protein n=1 Tax=Streptomyces zaomyceticus TaxID=68286 RepID=UPI003658AE13
MDADDHVVGVVSESDLLARDEPAARDLMTGPAITVHAEETVPDAAALMLVRLAESLDGVVAVVDQPAFHADDTPHRPPARTPHPVIR